jgi:hypothetical protein
VIFNGTGDGTEGMDAIKLIVENKFSGHSATTSEERSALLKLAKDYLWSNRND